MSIALQDRFVSDLPELAVRWQAESAPEPRLLVLNTVLAGELGLDPDWLRGAGLGLLLGSDVPEGAAPAAQAYAGHPLSDPVEVFATVRAWKDALD